MCNHYRKVKKMATAKLNSNITRFLGGVTQGKLGKKNITVQVGRIDNAVLGADGKPKVRYRLVVNGKKVSISYVLGKVHIKFIR